MISLWWVFLRLTVQVCSLQRQDTWDAQEMQTHAEYQVMLVLLSKRAASHIKPISECLHYWLDRYRQADVSQGLKWTPAIRRQTIKDEMPSETCLSNHHNNSLFNSAFHHCQKLTCTWSHPLSRQNSSHSHHAQLIFSLSSDSGRTSEIWSHCGAAFIGHLRCTTRHSGSSDYSYRKKILRNEWRFVLFFFISLENKPDLPFDK